MATLDDLKGVLESIDRSMTDQKNLLTNMFNLQQTQNRLSSVNTSTIQAQTSIGQNLGAAVSGIGAGIGSAAGGLGIGALLGLGSLAIFESFDADKIKENVTTLLSISDEVDGKVELLKEGGTFFLAMTGLGLGLAAFSAGQSLTALGQWITDEDWSETLKNNVINLLSIADDVGGNVSLLYEGGTIGLALSGLGAGLAIFGTGQSLTALGQWMTDDGWANTVKNNVTTLLSISDGIGENISNLYESGAFMSAMVGLGAGLAVFGVGQAAVGLAQFISSDDWAEKVKNNVSTLLSISDLPGLGWDTASFVAVMAGISAGLTAFALGKGAATVVEGAAEAISFFSGANFADKIKSEVQTLLSIPQMEGVGADTANFIAVMAGITTGLAAFALGKGAATVVEGAAEALAYFTGDEPFAERIKSEVSTLLSIIGLAPEGSVDDFVNIMSKLGDGLSSFAGSNFVGTLKNAGAAIISFFTGAESPFEQIRLIAADANNLMKAADAIDKIAKSLEKFGSINVDVGQIDFEGLAENLGKALPLLNGLANGGKVGEGIFDGPEIDFKGGLLDPSLKLDEMSDAISKVNYILGQSEAQSGIAQSAASAVRPVMAEPDIAILSNQTENMVILAENILKSLEIIESVVAPAASPASVTTAAVNSGNVSSIRSQNSTQINVMPKTYSELNDGRFGLPSGIGVQ